MPVALLLILASWLSGRVLACTLRRASVGAGLLGRLRASRVPVRHVFDGKSRADTNWRMGVCPPRRGILSSPSCMPQTLAYPHQAVLMESGSQRQALEGPRCCRRNKGDLAEDTSTDHKVDISTSTRRRSTLTRMNISSGAQWLRGLAHSSDHYSPFHSLRTKDGISQF